jgi:hypothetical protein
VEYSFPLSIQVAFDGHYNQGRVVLKLCGGLFRPRWSSELQHLWCGHVFRRLIKLVHGLHRGGLFGDLKCAVMYCLRRRILLVGHGLFVLRLCSGEIFKYTRGSLVQLLQWLRRWSVFKHRSDIVRVLRRGLLFHRVVALCVVRDWYLFDRRGGDFISRVRELPGGSDLWQLKNGMHELHGRKLRSINRNNMHELCCGHLLNRDGGAIIGNVRELPSGSSPIVLANFVRVLYGRLLCRVRRIHVLRDVQSRLVFCSVRIGELHELRGGVFRLSSRQHILLLRWQWSAAGLHGDDP